MSSSSIEIFDSNIWILALTDQSKNAERLVGQAVAGSRTVGVSPYIATEVYRALRSSNNSNWQTLATGLFTQIQQTNSIRAPSQRDIHQLDITRVRSQREIKLLAELLGIQPKDAPVVAYAKEHARQTPTIHTNDRPFSRLTPSAHDIGWLSLRHVT